jgi:tetratricopeptide (TPR) repeat protein
VRKTGLDDHAAGGGPPLVVLGDSGSGKSALLANWAERYSQARPGDFVLVHFIGATPDSADWVRMLRRIIGELTRRFDIAQEVPENPDRLQSAFASYLQTAADRAAPAGRRIVLILDGLNQLEDRDGALDLAWLPSSIPSRVRLIVSTLAGRPLEDLRRRGWPTLSVEPLALDERKQLIRRYLQRYAKELAPRRVDRIATSDGAANPLYLRALLEELRVFGIYDRLDSRIEHYLAGPSIAGLYGRILQRYEQDYDLDRPGLVRDTLSLLWAARRGLSEAELLHLLSAPNLPLPRAHWSPLYLALEPSLVQRSGLIGFFHDYLRRAVQDRYLPTRELQVGIRQRLADHFESREIGARKAAELPWLLAETKSWSRLADLLANYDFLAAAWEADKYDVKKYWALVEQRSHRCVGDAHAPVAYLVDAYRAVVEQPARYPELTCVIIFSLLEQTGHPREALAISAHFVGKARQTGANDCLQHWLARQARIVCDLGDLDTALRLYDEAERLCRRSGNLEGLTICRLGKASILRTRGDLDGALALYRGQEGICRELGDSDGLRETRGAQGLILWTRGDLDAALQLHKEEEQMYRRRGDLDGASHSLGNQALIWMDRGELDKARSLFREQERICRRLGNQPELMHCLHNQALVYLGRGDLPGAWALLIDARDRAVALGHRAALQGILGDQAIVLYRAGDLDRALGLLLEQEQICRELSLKEGLVNALGQQARIRGDRGEVDTALALLETAERLCRELGKERTLQLILRNKKSLSESRADASPSTTALA